MAVYQYNTSDIKKAVLRACGEVDDGTSFYEVNGQVMNLINRAYLAILSGGNEFDVELSKPWVWAKEPKPGVFLVKPAIDPGLVSVTTGSNKVTFTTAPATSVKDYWIKISDRDEWFRVLAHSAGALQATIDVAYPLSGGTFSAQLILIDYTLSPANGILRLVHPFVLYKYQDRLGDNEDKLYFMDQAEMLKEYPLRLIDNRIPTHFCLTYQSPAGAMSIRINSYPTDPLKVEYEYIKVPDLLTDGTNGTLDSIPILPIEHRDCLAFAAQYFLCTEKNDSRAQAYLQQTQSKLKAMQKAEEKQKTQISGMDRGRTIPRMDTWWRLKRRQSQQTS